MLQITPVPIFTDNYVWILHNQQSAIAIDPGASAPVLSFLQSRGLVLTNILITHHHPDHTGGVDSLYQQTHCSIHAPKQTPLSHCDQRLEDADTVEISSLSLTLKVITLPGHTLDHIGYQTDEAIFCGDTLFVGGCGRIFEGTADMMLGSLEKIAALPEHFRLYCAHEYTLANYQFAATVDPENMALKQQIQLAKEKRSQHKPTVPSTIGIERATNPFLRCHTDAIKQSVDKQCQLNDESPLQVFTQLRQWKNNFQID